MSLGETLQLHISRRRIAGAVRRLARRIEEDYPQELPLLVGVLSGSFVFMADLARALSRDAQIDFLRIASYGRGSVSSGSVTLRMDVAADVRGRHALIVEDIVDTGRTTEFAVRHLRRKGAASVRLCTLLDKPSRRVAPIEPDYVGFTVPDKFIVGYGLDYGERYRSLPDIYVLTGGPDGSG